MADPVSWFVIEHGWQVVGRDGERGRHGRRGRSATRTPTSSTGSRCGAAPVDARYVPSESVDEIIEGTVRLDLTKDDVEALQADPPGP